MFHLLKASFVTALSSSSEMVDNRANCLTVPTQPLVPTPVSEYPDSSISRMYETVGIDIHDERSATNALPAVIDYRLADGVVTPVKDQGGCGSCWAFSSAESIEGQLGLNGHTTNVSAQNFVDCVKLDYGCAGSWMDDALAYAEFHGVESEANYPYNGITQPCQANVSEATIRPTAYVNVAKNDHALKAALLTFGPVSIALDATDAFMSYAPTNVTNEVFTDDTCDPTMPDHALLLVGYNDNIGYWIVKNSWNTGWGLDGYIYINNTVPNQCGIASYATVPYIAPKSMEEERQRVCAHLTAVGAGSIC